MKDEGFYTMGRRFPSIRLKSKDKKDAKKIGAGSCASSDKAVEVNGAKGSCVRATSGQSSWVALVSLFLWSHYFHSSVAETKIS